MCRCVVVLEDWSLRAAEWLGFSWLPFAALEAGCIFLGILDILWRRSQGVIVKELIEIVLVIFQMKVAQHQLIERFPFPVSFIRLKGLGRLQLTVPLLPNPKRSSLISGPADGSRFDKAKLLLPKYLSLRTGVIF